MLLRHINTTKHRFCTRCLTYYDILGIPRTATKAEIKEAYLGKAKECHPDLNPDNVKAAVLFQELQEARDTLMDSQLRAQYNSKITQESYYGSQETHRSPPRRKSNVRTHGFTGHYNTVRNDKFHENHRVNRDNYQEPGSQRKHTLRKEPGPRSHDDVFPSNHHSATSLMRGVYVLGAAFLGLTLYSVIKRVQVEDVEAQNKLIQAESSITTSSSQNSNEASKQLASKIVSEPRRYVYNADQDATIRDIPKPKKTNSANRASGPSDQEIVRYVWSEEKENLVKINTFRSGHGAKRGPENGGQATIVDLKDRFDVKMQKNLGDVKIGKECESETDEDTEYVSLADIRTLKKELNKKKADYVDAKTLYAEKLELYRNELKRRKKSDGKIRSDGSTDNIS